MATVISAVVDPIYKRIGITITGITSLTVTLERIDSRDNSVTPVRGANPLTAIAGAWFGYDYEAPLNVPVTYRVSEAGFVWTTTPASLTVPAARAWLRSPTTPIVNSEVIIYTNPTMTRTLPQGVHVVLGRADPIVTSGTRSTVKGTVELLTSSLAAGQALVDLLESNSVFLLQVPRSRFGERWVTFGEWTEAPLSRLLTEESVRWTLPFIEVGRPSGDIVGDPTASYQAVVNTYATYQALLNGKASYLDLVKGVGAPVKPPNPGTL